MIFPVSTDLLTDKLADLIVNLTVLKRNPENNDIVVGKGTLDLTKEFLAIRKEVIDFGKVLEIPSQVFQGDVELVHDGESVGNANIFVRISSPGQCAVTALDDVLGKSSDYAFKYVAVRN